MTISPRILILLIFHTLCFPVYCYSSERPPSLFIGMFNREGTSLDPSLHVRGDGHEWSLSSYASSLMATSGHIKQLNLIDGAQVELKEGRSLIAEARKQTSAKGDFNHLSFVTLNAIQHDFQRAGRAYKVNLYSSMTWVTLASELSLGELVPHVAQSETRGLMYACDDTKLPASFSSVSLADCYKEAISENLRVLLGYVNAAGGNPFSDADKFPIMLSGFKSFLGENEIIDLYVDLSERQSQQIDGLGLFSREVAEQQFLSFMEQHLESRLAEEIAASDELSKTFYIVPSPLNLSYIRQSWDKFLVQLETLGDYSFGDGNGRPILKKVIPLCSVDGEQGAVPGYWLQSGIAELKGYHKGKDNIKSVDGVVVAVMGQMVLPLSDSVKLALPETQKPVAKQRMFAKGFHEVETIGGIPEMDRYSILDASMSSLDRLAIDFVKALIHLNNNHSKIYGEYILNGETQC